MEPASIAKTADGSSTIYSERFKEHYHSTHGALTESRHVFIKHGLAELARRKKRIRILEMGFGTGLNALLSLQYCLDHSCEVEYTGYEPYPIGPNIAAALRYPEILDDERLIEAFDKMHMDAAAYPVQFDNSFDFYLVKEKLSKATLIGFFDLVYFDAFSPEKAPECWTPALFRDIAAHLRPEATLVTYCSKGVVRRDLQAAGFRVEKLPGPPGKREMIRAICM